MAIPASSVSRMLRAFEPRPHCGSCRPGAGRIDRGETSSASTCRASSSQADAFARADLLQVDAVDRLTLRIPLRCHASRVITWPYRLSSRRLLLWDCGLPPLVVRGGRRARPGGRAHPAGDGRGPRIRPSMVALWRAQVDRDGQPTVDLFLFGSHGDDEIHVVLGEGDRAREEARPVSLPLSSLER